MKSIYRSNFAYPKIFFAAILFLAARFDAQVVQTFTHTGSMQTFIVPSCVSTITVDARGASGGDGGKFTSSTASPAAAGKGGRVVTTLAVTPGQTLYVFVGGAGAAGSHTTGGVGGFNGGGLGRNSTGSGGGGGGGGASDVRLNGTALTDRIIVAAGGGGGGGSGSASSNGGEGGAGGGLSGSAGGNGTTTYGIGGGGGTSTSGGAAGGTMTGPTAGSLGIGGDGSGILSNGSGGGGGGGYYGGGGGGTNLCSGCTTSSGGGGGGSSYNGPGTSNAVHTASYQTGAGAITFSYTFNGGVVSISPSATTICSGTNLTLTATGATNYTWSTTANTNTISVTPNTTTSYTVEGTNSNSCISTAVITVTVNTGLPTLTVTQSTTSVCPGQSLTLSAAGANSYTWTGGISNGVPFSPAVTSTYIVTGQNACGTISASSPVTVSPLPVQIASTHTSVCTNKSATLTAISTGTSYNWQPVNITGASSVIFVNPSVNTIYTVTASDGTCSGSATVALVSDPVPTINVSASATMICPGESSTLTATGGQTYNWSPGGSTATMIVVSPTVSTLYMVTVSNSFGCETNASVPVITKTQPTVSIFTAANPVCAGVGANLTASGADVFEWDNGPNTNTYQVMPAQTTTYIVSGTLTSSGCASTASLVLDVFAPQMSITGNSVICAGGSASLTASAPGASSFTWSPANFYFNPLVVSPTISTSYVASASSFSGALECPVSGTVLVQVNNGPAMTAMATRSVICRTESTTLSATGATSYTWTHSTGTVGAAAVVTIAPKTAVLSTYTVIGTDATGCVTTKTVLLSVNVCGGLEEAINENSGFQLYPNPSSGNITIAVDRAAELQLISETGQLLRTFSVNEENGYKISIGGLSAGLYFIKGTNGVSRKIVVH